MKALFSTILASAIAGVFSSCQESGARGMAPAPEKGMVSGKVTDATGKPLKNVEIALSHTVWSDKKITAHTDENGEYTVTLPAEPRGNWTIRATHYTAAYGNRYTFALDANDNRSFGGARGAIRNFTWRMLGEHIGGRYGAEVEVITENNDILLPEVKLIFSPLEDFLVDGSEAKALEKKLEQNAGRYTAAFIPIGKYQVQAVYKGKPLKLYDQHYPGDASESVEVTFKQNDASTGIAFKSTLFIQ